MIGDTHFQRYIPDPHPEDLVSPEEIQRHILCTGQLYYTLLQARQERNIKNIAISRLEQISPFPYDLVRRYTRERTVTNNLVAYTPSGQVPTGQPSLVSRRAIEQRRMELRRS